MQDYIYPDVSGGAQRQYPHQDLEESEGEEQSESEEDARMQGPMGCALISLLHERCSSHLVNLHLTASVHIHTYVRMSTCTFSVYICSECNPMCSVVWDVHS